MTLTIHIAFRTGFRWPLRPGDIVELWQGHELVGTISADLVLQLIAHNYTGVQMQARMREELLRSERVTVLPYVPKPPTKVLPVTRDQMDTRRENRRRHRRNQ